VSAEPRRVVSGDGLVELAARGYDTDKSEGYLRRYESFFAPLRESDVRLLEIGVLRGGSLLLWRDYFRRGVMAGLDQDPVELDDRSGRIRFFQGDQGDTELLTRIAMEIAPDGFDVVIDDASHIASPTRTGFWHIFENHLKPGGVYVVEDWGTGYWKSWPDGRAYRGPKHTAGMVGLVKELIDECGIADITHPELGKPPQRHSRIKHMLVSYGQVFVVKTAGQGS
jgi:SAM-dependent methyltransferase